MKNYRKIFLCHLQRNTQEISTKLSSIYKFFCIEKSLSTRPSMDSAGEAKSTHETLNHRKAENKAIMSHASGPTLFYIPNYDS